MDTNKLIIYSMSSIGIITLLHQLLKIIRRREHIRQFFRNKVVLITGASSGLGKKT